MNRTSRWAYMRTQISKAKCVGGRQLLTTRSSMPSPLTTAQGSYHNRSCGRQIATRAFSLARSPCSPYAARTSTMSSAGRVARGARSPSRFRDDQFDRGVALAPLGVVAVAHANKARAETLDELAGAVLARPEGEAGLHARGTPHRGVPLTLGRQELPYW